MFLVSGVLAASRLLPSPPQPRGQFSWSERGVTRSSLKSPKGTFQDFPKLGRVRSATAGPWVTSLFTTAHNYSQ